MVRVSTNRGTSTRNVKSGRSKSKKQNQVQDLVGELLAEVAEDPNLAQQV